MGQIPMKKWADICKPRGKGGLLGLRRMRNFNNALLAKLGRECLDRNFYSIPKAYSIFCLWKHICDSRNLIKRASCDSLQFSSCGKQILQIFLVWFCLKQKKHRFYYPSNNAHVYSAEWNIFKTPNIKSFILYLILFRKNYILIPKVLKVINKYLGFKKITN